MKGRIMKSSTVFNACLPVLFVLFTAELCRADIGFLASMGNNLAMSEVNGASAVPNYDDVWNAGALRDPKENGSNKFSKSSAASDGFAYANVSARQTGVDSTDNPRRRTEVAESSLEQYVFIAIVSGAVGLGLIAVGIVQFRQRRSIKQYWLFPAVPNDGEPSAPVASLPAKLIAKKQQKETFQEKDTKIPAQRRAA
jgi:hypothetical protein